MKTSAPALRGLLLLLVVGGLPLSVARATVLATGDVNPIDSPYTTANEGVREYVPDLGSIFDPPGTLPPQDTFEHADNIVVGDTFYGTLLINGGSQVRYQHLVIGGSEANVNFTGLSDAQGTGAGIVRLEGFGTLFNNNPAIVPPAYAALDGGAKDQTIRPTDGGFDVYVGLSGSGTLQVTTGARMEIQDSLVVGLQPGSLGDVLVDGISSYIDARGVTDTGTGPGSDPVASISVGSTGDGTVTIRNGAKVDARTGVALGALTAEGERRPIGGLTSNYPGGLGVMTVDGLGTSLRANNGIAVGQYEPEDIDYEFDFGRGVLTVGNSAVVTVSGEDIDDQFLRIGHQGRVDLNAGRLNVEGEFESDGVFRGDGRLDAGTFYNRRLGDMRVAIDQKLLVVSNAEDPIDVSGTPIFMANTGRIEAIGGEIEFRRSPGPTPLDDVFKNLRLAEVPPPMPGDPAIPAAVGTIIGQDAVYRFTSGCSMRARSPSRPAPTC